MRIVNLPKDILPEKKDREESVTFYEFTAPVSGFKGRMVLHKNTISLVTSGEKTMQFAERTVLVKEDEFHFLSSGNCLASINLSDKHLFQCILIFFDNDLLANFYLKYYDKIQVAKGKNNIAREPYVAFKKDPFVLNFIDSVQVIFRTKSHTSAEMKLLKLEELLLYLLEQYPIQFLSFHSTENHTFDDFSIRKTVETYAIKNIRLEELAFLCNISISTFKRRFVKIYGTSPNKWMLNKRMEMAKDLLLHHHQKPSEVYHKVGYENHSSFSHSFRQTFGMTPKEFQLQQLTFLR